MQKHSPVINNLSYPKDLQCTALQNITIYSLIINMVLIYCDKLIGYGYQQMMARVTSFSYSIGGDEMVAVKSRKEVDVDH